MHLLYVCTGNLCRSQVAAGLTEAWMRRASAQEVGEIVVRSAGTNAAPGTPVDLRSAAALARLGGNPDARAATALTADLASGADLVLTMTRRHRRAVLELAPRNLRRTFTLLEAADLVTGIDVRDLAHLSVDDRARELGRRLDAARARRRSGDQDDIEDPVGRRQPVHDAVADTIARALRPVLSALLPAPARRHHGDRPGGAPVAHQLRTGDLAMPERSGAAWHP